MTYPLTIYALPLFVTTIWSLNSVLGADCFLCLSLILISSRHHHHLQNSRVKSRLNDSDSERREQCSRYGLLQDDTEGRGIIMSQNPSSRLDVSNSRQQNPARLCDHGTQIQHDFLDDTIHRDRRNDTTLLCEPSAIPVHQPSSLPYLVTPRKRTIRTAAPHGTEP